MKKEYSVNAALLAAIIGIIVVAACGCSGGDSPEASAPEVASDSGVPSIHEPMDYNSDKYTDEQVIKHYIGRTYLEFDPKNAADRIPVIERKLEEKRKAVERTTMLIDYAKERLARFKKDLDYFPAGYLNWNEYQLSLGKNPYKKRDELKSKISTEESVISGHLPTLSADKFQVKLKIAEIDYLKSLIAS